MDKFIFTSPSELNSLIKGAVASAFKDQAEITNTLKGSFST